jgi:hypothetical protein
MEFVLGSPDVDFDHDLQNNNRKIAGSVSDPMKPGRMLGF